MRTLPLFALLVGLAACAGTSRVTDTPTDDRSPSPTSAEPRLASNSPSDLTDFAQALFAQLSPELEVQQTEPLSLVVPEAGAVISLDRIHDNCRSVPSECEAELRSFVASVLQALERAANETDEASLDRIMPVLRPEGYAAQVEATGGVPSLPFLNGLNTMLVVDFPTSTRALTTNDLESLGLTAEQAYARALQNLAAAFAQSGATIERRDNITQLPPNYYNSSLLLLDQLWAAPSVGDVYVAIPHSDKLLFTTSRLQVPALFVITEALLQRSQRPSTSTVFHWTDEGWEVVDQAEFFHQAQPNTP